MLRKKLQILISHRTDMFLIFLKYLFLYLAKILSSSMACGLWKCSVSKNNFVKKFFFEKLNFRMNFYLPNWFRHLKSKFLRRLEQRLVKIISCYEIVTKIDSVLSVVNLVLTFVFVYTILKVFTYVLRFTKLMVCLIYVFKLKLVQKKSVLKF